MHRRVFYAIVLLAMMGSSVVAAPAMVPYVGQLTHDNGVPYEGTVQIEIAVYTDSLSGDLLFAQQFDDVDVANGVFTVLLGSEGNAAALDIAWMSSDELWLEFTINEVALSPRQQVLAVPFARICADAERLGGLLPGDYLVSGGDASFGVVDATEVSSSGGVQIGNDTADCVPAKAGTIRWNGTAFEGCDGTAWVGLAGAGLAPGQTQSNPALSCDAIHTADSSLPSGIYFLDPNGGDASDAFEAYCDMVSDGGGWTLILKTTTDGTLTYSSALWTNTTTLNPGSPDPSEANAKYPAFNSITGTTLRGCKGASAPCVTYSTAATTALELFGGATLNDGPGRAAFTNVFGFDDATQANCNHNGINIDFGGTTSKARFGVVGNNENDCNTTDSAWGFGISRQSTACGAGAVTWDGSEPETGHCQYGTLWIR